MLLTYTDNIIITLDINLLPEKMTLLVYLCRTWRVVFLHLWFCQRVQLIKEYFYKEVLTRRNTEYFFSKALTDSVMAHLDNNRFVSLGTTSWIRIITKLPNSEQSYKGKVKTHNYINRQNQSTTGKLWIWNMISRYKQMKKNNFGFPFVNFPFLWSNNFLVSSYNELYIPLDTLL